MSYLIQRLKKPAASVFFGFAFFLAQVLAASADGQLENPLRDQFSDVPRFIAGALQVLVMIALPVIVLFFVVAGFRFISAQGNPGKLEEARKNFMWVVFGALLIMGAWVLSTLIAATVSELLRPL